MLELLLHKKHRVVSKQEINDTVWPDEFMSESALKNLLGELMYENSKHIHITITDNAGGIKAIPIAEIFKLGFSNKKVMDSGVGLYIAKQLIEKKICGSIHAENTDVGAAFRISIPLLYK
ncbi:hypothetical protein MNBD_GAMMA06-325 [hydrothermal vent metagenome]|uniref:Histidine kinase/HSP90-like ATPase domain-containing protein n=1 Tax=hydrothermal vent metagenome TaxID=652676 RepID=A0A3B0W6P7_9ZZZZ